ncbi:MAG: hypothetical protein EOR00_22250 [Mesorhizobium sp.]|uniref:hypothetical protein n=1 Tax=Mesorhizobium sp. TaxID=1871066 RepID=UPI000FE4797B|nr:hypothetical protein [Mesorhizobium sp.]RWP14933.1 MAG: hypothetical protein EOR00_22250 [Mesorhizobium sp.]
MRRLMLLALAIMPATAAFADESYPSYVTVQNTDGMSVISAVCDPPKRDEMHCTLTKITVTRPDEGEAANRIAKAIDQIVKSKAFTSQQCDQYAELATALQTGIAPPFATDKQRFHTDWLKESPAEKADAMLMVKAILAYCTTPNQANAGAIAKASEELESTTCQISNWKSEQTFTLNYSTKKWQSTTQNNDSCGTITYSEFSKPDLKDSSYLWNYTTKDIVTNLDGKNIVDEACSVTDQTEHRYSWQTGKFYANCRYVQITP